MPHGKRSGVGRFFRLEEVPEIAPGIAENRDRAVRLLRRFANEDDALAPEHVVVAGEVVGVQEQEDPAARLVADTAGLLGTGRARQEKPGSRGSGRSDHDPALVLLGNERILDEGEAEDADVEGEGLVVLRNHQRDETDGLLHGAGSSSRRATRPNWDRGWKPCLKWVRDPSSGGSRNRRTDARSAARASGRAGCSSGGSPPTSAGFMKSCGEGRLSYRNAFRRARLSSV